MVINSLPVQKVIVDYLQILEGFSLALTIFFPISSCLLTIVTIVHTICGHQQHHIVWLFHGINMKWLVIKHSSPRISVSNILICKMCLDLLSSYELWPISSLFDESNCKHTFFAQLNDSFQYTQKPLSRITMNPLKNIGASSHNNNPTVTPRSSYVCCSI